MYIPASVKCDVCEKIHTETNGWYTVRIIDWKAPEGGERKIEILSFSDKDAQDFYALCGDNCLGKFISQKAPTLREEK